MKRVLIISQNFYPEIGSAANRIKNIYVELSNQGYKVKVLTADPSYPNRNIYRKNPEFWNEDIPDEDIIRIKTKTRKYTRNILNRFLLYIEVLVKLIFTISKLDKQYDVIFATSPPIFIGFAGMFAKFRLKKKLILDVRDLWPESLLGVGVFTNKLVLKLSYFLEQKLYDSAEKIIVNSEGFIPYITSKGINKEDIIFIPNSLTEEELSKKPKAATESNETKTIIYTGNLGLAQDLLTLVELAEMFQQRSDIHFKIIGYGFKKDQVKNLVDEKHLSNIEIIQVKNRKDTLKEVSLADIAYVGLVEKSVFQTVLPGKIIDYMCMQKPIVGNIEGYSKKVIKEAKCGFVSDDRKTVDLYESISKLIGDEQLRNQLGQNGYEYAKKHLRWKKNISRLTRVIENI
ncbi:MULTISPECIES: glycosyltransferase family 4 protein [Metabacillus]|uniref:Glycosyltransferase WbuB n=2 Tax=Metabacillus TaxID=2675233 RepID=A0A179T2H1_9BACI|nr:MULTISPECIES: glycosyltransferase family 4 protein [Metabacillus]OAS88207.1 glycosyltransferase WbuB [Metabacillus litoralis]QNF27361.1 glycosyltransferase family 4 protein [Metabacillus sp. KUDC1714]